MNQNDDPGDSMPDDGERPVSQAGMADMVGGADDAAESKLILALAKIIYFNHINDTAMWDDAFDPHGKAIAYGTVKDILPVIKIYRDESNGR